LIWVTVGKSLGTTGLTLQGPLELSERAVHYILQRRLPVC